ncbi:hypothetical protein PRUB_a0098 [Pseudoalteromonas rubra]|uniref:H-type lectin domain-containing protein n=1 Tax=Pseudoalteromonas rubra TaxID=43658 RepID=A0A8T0C4X7_9GAMM|nr:hypothetical protein [Pseudoalteromonas rubra]KAF7785729.1 hypothetical protein PRUB_a0098 [Pseudoalteromonas rubra]
MFQVVGKVASDGSKRSGAGFSSEKLRPGETKGHYQVTFNDPFVSEPVILVTANVKQQGNYDVAFNATVHSADTDKFEVQIQSPETPLECGFDFIAIGVLEQ